MKDRFTARATRYVEEEVWQPEQRNDKEGPYLLEVPYVHFNELV